MSPFPFLVDPVATFIVPRSRKLTSHRTKTKTKVHHHNTSNGKGINSKVAIALICVGVALIVIGIAMSIYFRRRKAKQNAARNDDENDREVGMSENLVGGPAPSGPPAYSSDANGGLYGGSGGAAAYKDASRSSSEYGSDHEGRLGGNLGGSRKGGYSAVDTAYDPGAGEAASYYAQGPQSGYDHVPQRPPMAFKVSPTPV
ncbi:hypothetical protein SLS53_004866 [Cytospora paraplurivora]|uniref:Uncharacterized protein n=1 Tax=Cytospora paraplurivora TaxID=2898453 RepID=A0AAN9YF63_9PEZI